MKNLMTFALLISFSFSVMAENETSPLVSLRSDLNSSLEVTNEKMSLKNLKTLADERNTDMDVAFENYIIAKRRVAVARAAFNPLTTGHALGIALGLTYLWAPIAIEAVLSIPTKLYNVSSNKYLAKAALYNSYDAKNAINNELAHLYYDVLTHEVLLKSVDKEIAVLMYQQASLEKSAPESRKARIDYDKAAILSLKMERIDIYNLYKEELAALKTLLTLNPDDNTLNLAQNNVALSRSFLAGIDLAKLQDFSIVQSNKYKTHINLDRAAEQNVKSVQWSILSFNGLNFSYKSRVRSAKIDAGVAELNKQSTALNVRNEVLMSHEKLDSSIGIAENYGKLSDDSMGFFEDNFELFQNGVKPEEYAIESSIGAIRDFRSKVIAHYASWSAFDDFSKSASFPFVYKTEADNAQKQIEGNELYDISESDFKVVQDGSFNSASVFISSKNLSVVEKVEYRFTSNNVGKLSSSSERRKFEVSIQNEDSRIGNLSGTAIVLLKNGHELSIKF
jgi:hypothetical protein